MGEGSGHLFLQVEFSSIVDKKNVRNCAEERTTHLSSVLLLEEFPGSITTMKFLFQKGAISINDLPFPSIATNAKTKRRWPPQ